MTKDDFQRLTPSYNADILLSHLHYLRESKLFFCHYGSGYNQSVVDISLRSILRWCGYTQLGFQMSIANVAVPKNKAGSLIQSLLRLMERFPLISVGFHSCSLEKRVRESFYMSISEKNKIET